MDALRFLLVLTIIITSSSAAAANNSDKVLLELYYEALCPYCANFIVRHLHKLFESGLISITDLKFIPYGNAEIIHNDTIICQHGSWECFLNTIEACAIDTWPEDVLIQTLYINCVESFLYQQNNTHWEICIRSLGLDANPVINCYDSGRGKELELQYAAVTNALKPPHKFVPWVVVNGQPLYNDYKNFIRYICNAYNGSAIPFACTGTSIGTHLKGPRYCKFVEFVVALLVLCQILAELND